MIWSVLCSCGMTTCVRAYMDLGACIDGGRIVDDILYLFLSDVACVVLGRGFVVLGGCYQSVGFVAQWPLHCRVKRFLTR